MSDPFDTGVVTIMFTDVEGSTDLTRRLGDEAARRTIDAHRRIVRAKIAEHDGREIDSIGDGFMITFLSTRRAVACAVAIHEALAEHSRANPDEDVRVRIGLNVGEVLERGGHPFGAAVNATQRVAAHAKGGQTFVSEPVRHLAGTIPDVTFRERGRFQLKGFDERWRLYEVLWRGRQPTAAPRSRPAPGRPPVWWRRRTTLAAAAALAALALAAGAFAVLRGDATALSRIDANHVGIIDPGSGDIVGAVPVGSEPVDIAYGEGALWVANLRSGTVTKIDPESETASSVLSTGEKPTGIGAGEGSVWVANGFANQLSIVDPASAEATGTIEGLAGPKGVVVGFGAVWVVNATDGTIVRIDVRTREPRVVAPGRAVAVGPNAVWISSATSVRRVDPDTGRPVGRAIELRFPPSRLAVDPTGVVWITHPNDDRVSYVEPEGGSGTIEEFADGPTGIATGEGAVWVASAVARSVTRIDPATRATRRIPVGASPEAIVVADGRIWVAARGP